MLEGTLVRLRAMEPEDVVDTHKWMNDREVTLWLTSPRYPVSRKTAQQWFEEAPANSFGDVLLAIETKDGKHIGGINLHRINPEDRKAVLGIMIGEKDHWSNGYGTDAIKTLLAFAFDEMNLHRVFLHAFADNEHAIGCSQRCGFREEGRLRQEVYQDGHYYDVVVMGVLATEFAEA
jgi:RimJ/RimL family protein N-acetyltransferase